MRESNSHSIILLLFSYSQTPGPAGQLLILGPDPGAFVPMYFVGLAVKKLSVRPEFRPIMEGGKRR